MIEDAIAEAAFQIYREFTRERDPIRARQRWERVPARTKDQWFAEAKAAHRVFEIYARQEPA